MELYEESKNEKSTDKKSKKTIKILIVLLVLVIIAIIALMITIYYMQEQQFKVNIDGKRANLPGDTFVFEGDNIYVSIKDFAQNNGYTYHNGEYKHQYSEETDKCYIYNENEIASYTLDSDTIYKVLNTSSQSSNEETDYEYFTIEEPVIMINNKLYTTLEGISKGCNVSIGFNQESNTVTVYTLDYLATFYSARIPTSIFVEGASAQSNEDYFSNKKAILYNMMVVKDTNENYGVYDLSGNTIIGEKYKNIKFIESSQEFIVQTDNDKMGIIASDATTKIEPIYDLIKQIDKDLELYLVSNENKYGVINGSGRTIVFLEYTQIGIDANDFGNDNIKNQYLLYNKCIPVCQNNKWGMLDTNGNTILPVQYDGFGCMAPNSASSSLLLIPEYQAFVVQEGEEYGLYNTSGNELIPTLVTTMYSVIASGEKSYYLIYQGNTMDVIDYLSNTLKIQPVADENGEMLNTQNNNTNTQTENNQTNNTQTNNTQDTNTQTSNNLNTETQLDNTETTDIQNNVEETNNQPSNNQVSTITQTELQGIDEQNVQSVSTDTQVNTNNV